MPLAKTKHRQRAVDVAPVDVERAVALKKHEEGVTKSQDKGKRVGDASEELLATVAMALVNSATDRGNTSAKVRTADLRRLQSLASGSSMQSSVQMLAARDIGDKWARVSTDGLRSLAQHAKIILDKAQAKDNELPTAIKTSNLVPMPSGENNEVSYATRRAADAQHSGSAPADHLIRAVQYEIGGDRARALDSYRAAASGFRRASDRANEAKARDGIEACQTRFAGQYGHPGAGRVRVCDSAESATRTAIERTRAGEAVSVVGNKVMPRSDRARAADSKAKDVEVTYHTAPPPKKPKPLMNVTNKEDLAKMSAKGASSARDGEDYHNMSARELEAKYFEVFKKSPPHEMTTSGLATALSKKARATDSKEVQRV